MKTLLSYDKQPLSIGQKVYQIGSDSKKTLQLVTLEIIEFVDDDKIKCQIGKVQPVLYPNQVYSDPVGLVNVWIEQNLKWYQTSIPHNIFTLCKIKQGLVSVVDQETVNLMARFEPVKSDEII